MGDDGAVAGIDLHACLNSISIQVSRHSISSECNDEYPSRLRGLGRSCR